MFATDTGTDVALTKLKDLLSKSNKCGKSTQTVTKSGSEVKNALFLIQLLQTGMKEFKEEKEREMEERRRHPMSTLQ